MKNISASFDDDIISKLDEIAVNTSSTRSAVLNDAVTHYIEYIKWYKKEVEKGLDDINTNKVVSHDNIKESIKNIGINVD